MDIKRMFKAFEEGLKNAESNLENLKKEYEETKNKTSEFLEICSKVGIKKVGISKRDDSFKESLGWGFSEKWSVFADERTEDGWPAVWKAVEIMDISGGCGNSGQHQISDKATHFLQEGIYEFKNGKWYFKE